MLPQTAIFLTLSCVVLKGSVSAHHPPSPPKITASSPLLLTSHLSPLTSLCLFPSPSSFTPLARRDARDGLFALLVLLTTSTLCTVLVQLWLSTLLPFTFSPPAFLSGFLLSLSYLLLLPSIRLLGLSSLILHHLLSSLTSSLTLYGAGQLAILGYDYDAGASMRSSDVILTTIIAASAATCIMVAISNKVWADHDALHRTAQKGQGQGGWTLQEPPTRVRLTSAHHPPLTFETSGPYALHIERKESANDAVDLHPPSSSSSRGTRALLSSPLSPLSSLHSSSLLPLDKAAVAGWLRQWVKQTQLSSPPVRLSVGFACTAASAVLSSTHLLPLYATQKAGLLRLLPLTPYTISLHLGLLSSFVCLSAVVSLCRRTLPVVPRSIVLPSIAAGVALSLSSYFLLSHMPAHAAGDWSWLYYSQESDLLEMLMSAVPMVVVTACAWMVWREHQMQVRVDEGRGGAGGRDGRDEEDAGGGGRRGEGREGGGTEEGIGWGNRSGCGCRGEEDG